MRSARCATSSSFSSPTCAATAGRRPTRRPGPGGSTRRAAAASWERSAPITSISCATGRGASHRRSRAARPPSSRSGGMGAGSRTGRRRGRLRGARVGGGLEEPARDGRGRRWGNHAVRLSAVEQTYFRKGFGLKGAIEGALAADYHSRVVDAIRGAGYELVVGDLTFKLAGEFGFCYGVDRAVEYAYETRTKFPAKRVFLVGEIIHNPHVNSKLTSMGVHIVLRQPEGEFVFGAVTPDDVVILPAFGVTVQDFERLRAIGCVLVDTTCGSVLNVWKRVDSYARDGFTAVIHGN